MLVIHECSRERVFGLVRPLDPTTVQMIRDLQCKYLYSVFVGHFGINVRLRWNPVQRRCAFADQPWNGL